MSAGRNRAWFVLAVAALTGLALLAGRACDRGATGATEGAPAAAPAVEGAQAPGGMESASAPPPPLSRAETAEPAAAAGSVRLRFRDWHSGEDIPAAGVVELTPDGRARVAEPTPEGEYHFAPGAPIVLAAKFERHVPLLAVVRDAPAGELTPIHAYEAAQVTVEFEGCDPSRLPPDAKIRFRLEPSSFSLPRSEHGQFRSFQGFAAFLAQRLGVPDLSKPPAEWFPAEQAKSWREGALRQIRAHGETPPSPVAAITLGETGGERAATGAPVRLGPFPANYSVVWTTALPLAQAAPPQEPSRAAGINSEGVRSGSFVAPPGETLARLVWTTGASLRGRVPDEGLPGGVLPPQVSLAGVLRDEHSPPNGSLANLRPLDVDPVTGEFRAADLAPGEYQVNAAWSAGNDVKVSGTRVLLGPGDERDLGVCAVLPGPSLRLALECRDLQGNALRAEQLFREPGRMRGTISMMDRNEDALGSSVYSDLPIAFDSFVNLHGLRPGPVWAHASLSNQIEEADLLEGVRFLRFEPPGDRVELPEENQVRAAAVFEVGAVPVALRFVFPEEARGWKFSVLIVESRSGRKSHALSVDAERDPARRRDEASVLLAPGEYVLFAHVTGWNSAERGPLRHYAFHSFAVDGPNQAVEVPVLPGITARGVAEPDLRGSSDRVFLGVESINGVPEPSDAILTAPIAPDGSFVLEGVPPGAILRHRISKTAWTVNANGTLVRM